MDSHRHHINGFGSDGADQLAGPAPDAGIGFEPGMMNIIFQDGVHRMGGTHLGAGPAISFLGIHQAFILFKMNTADAGALFFFKGQG